MHAALKWVCTFCPDACEAKERKFDTKYQKFNRTLKTKHFGTTMTLREPTNLKRTQVPSKGERERL